MSGQRVNGAAGGEAPGAIVPLLAGIALLVFGTNLQGVLLPILAHERGAGMTTIGLLSAMWSLGFIVASATVGLLLTRLGQRRGFVLLALGSSAAALLFPLVPPDERWIALRLVSGFCYGGAAAIVEAWVLMRATSGRAFAQYMIANLLASLCGTFSLDLVRDEGPAPFLLAAGALALSLVPIVLLGSTLPVMRQVFRPRLGSLLRRSPLGAVGCLVSGLATGAIGGLAPLFGTMIGLDMGGDTVMLAANSVGGAVAYAPIAMLAERFGRRSLIAALAALGAMVCVPVVLLASDIGRTALVGLLFVFGIAQYPLYGLSVGLACEQSEGRPIPEVSSEGLLVFGVGTIVGPMLGVQIMRTGAANLFAMTGVLFLALLATAALGARRRDRTGSSVTAGVG